MAYNEDSSASGHDEPWIQWFCGLKGHEMFCEVERSYIEDGFNLYGLRTCVSNFSDCLDLILDRIGPDDSDDSHLTQRVRYVPSRAMCWSTGIAGWIEG